MVTQFDVYLVDLEPTLGVEIRKKRPCLIVSPNEMNGLMRSVIIAPMTTKFRGFPTRIQCELQDKTGFIVLDQIRAIDKVRLVKKLGSINVNTQTMVLNKLQEMFAV